MAEMTRNPGKTDPGDGIRLASDAHDPTAEEVIRACALFEAQADTLARTLGVDRSPGQTYAMASGTGAARLCPWPRDLEPQDADLERHARLILSAMHAGMGAERTREGRYERRKAGRRRRPFETAARLRLWADGPGAEPWFLYVRNAEPRGLGFICPDRLPLGYGGSLSLIGPNGSRLEADVTLVRCSNCPGGWYEGALTFTRRQMAFADLIDVSA